MPEVEFQRVAEEYKNKKDMKINKKITLGAVKKINNLYDVKYHKNITEYAKLFSVYEMKSYASGLDHVYSLIRSHCYLNGRDYMCDDDIKLLKITLDYLNNTTAPNRSKIIMFHNQGRSQLDICLLLGKNPKKYQPYVSKILSLAKIRGIIDDIRVK